MGNYARQHWVPQSYLRRFSPDGTHIWMFDKPTQRTAFPSIRDVAQGKYFYDGFLRDNLGVLPGDVPEGTIEREFQRWEAALTDMTEVASRIAAGGGAGLDERKTMSICVALQLLRTPILRSHLKDGAATFLEEDANAFLAREKPESATKYKVQIAIPDSWSGALHFEVIWSGDHVVRVATDIFHYIWHIGVAPSAIHLCTSDAPVTPFVHDTHQFRTTTSSRSPYHDVIRQVLVGGVSTRGVELAYPLTPELALLMYHPEYFAHLQPTQGKARRLTEDEASHYNALQ